MSETVGMARDWDGKVNQAKTSKLLELYRTGELEKIEKKEVKDKGVMPQAIRDKISNSNKGKHHSEEAKDKISEGLKGENHYNWQGGITSKIRKARNSREYRQWRKGIFERDNYTCQYSGETDCILHAHHIYNFEDSIPLRYELTNGIILSEEAHKLFHKRYGFRYNSQEQLDDFLEGSFF